MEADFNHTQTLSLKLAYDGTDFLGWQKTKMGPSIEQTLEDVLKKLTQKDLKIEAASRTDAGVHARGQIVSCTLSPRFSLRDFQYRINCLLPCSIQVLDIQKKDRTFHPTLNARAKEYEYLIETAAIASPFLRKTHWHYPHALDLMKMEHAKNHFIGQRDFAAFANHPCHKNTERKVFSISIERPTTDSLRFTITGETFLYKMVRNIVGTLVYVGRGLIDPDEIPPIFKSRLRKNAGLCAPAKGLTLKQVYY